MRISDWSSDVCSSDLGNLGPLKALVGELFDRASISAIMVQATATWLAFDADRLKVSAGLALADFPRIEDYPATEQSQRRSEERRVGKGYVSTCRTRWSPEH